MSDSQTSGLTRRELLKRGAAVGGALWAVPVVQMIGMNPAMAAIPSDVCFCVKLDGCDENSPFTGLGTSCIDEYGEVPGGCETPSDISPFGPFNTGECAETYAGDGICVDIDGTTVTVYFPDHCRLTTVAEKGGGPFSDPDACFFHLTGGSESSPYQFEIFDDCSHLEFCFQC